MQLGTTKSTNVENKDAHDWMASQPSTTSRDIKRVFMGSNQHMAIVRSTSVSGRAVRSGRRSGLDMIISNNI
jgi:hypothetical protein